MTLDEAIVQLKTFEEIESTPQGACVLAIALAVKFIQCEHEWEHTDNDNTLFDYKCAKCGKTEKWRSV